MYKIKNLVFIAVFISLSMISIGFCDNSTFGPNELPVELRKYMTVKEKDVEYKTVKFLDINAYAKGKRDKIPEYLTKKQALEDIDMLEYLFENAYSGKEYWEQNGINFSEMYNKLRLYVEGTNKNIKVKEIETIIVSYLKDIKDGHLGIYGKKMNRFFKHKDAYFADILLEKRGNTYFVIDSKIKNVVIGSMFNSSKENLFKTLSPKGKEHYLIGTLSYDDQIKNIELSFNNKQEIIPVHSCRIRASNSSKRFGVGNLYDFKYYDDVPIVSMKECPSVTQDVQDKLIKLGGELKDKSLFVWDLRGNGGGSSDFPMTFIKGLNKVAEWQMIEGMLVSPATMQSEYNSKYIKENELNAIKNKPVRKWRIWNNNSERKLGTYKGVMIVVQDRWIGSSGEAAIDYSRSVGNSLRIGENTAGVGVFGEAKFYYLPNSKIIFQLPYKIFKMKNFEETIGFTPDYWVDKKNPTEEAIRWYKNHETYQYKFEIESSSDVYSYVNSIKGIFLKKNPGVCIIPTNEENKKEQNNLYLYVRKMNDMFLEEYSILTDKEALKQDLSKYTIIVYGTPKGNLWLAKYINMLPVRIESDKIVADTIYSGTNLRFITDWYNPQNPENGVLIYTAQKTEDVIGINSVFHGPTDYVIAKDKEIFVEGNYIKQGKRWTLELTTENK
ncbi:MAG: S41 family peptidase [Elusimicrobia bacterium]|nr:S41 family peptidase [Elusimicrobiota bacterium]